MIKVFLYALPFLVQFILSHEVENLNSLYATNKRNQKNGTITRELKKAQVGSFLRREQFVPYDQKASIKNYLKQKYYEYFDSTRTLTYKLQQQQLNKTQDHKLKNKNKLLKADEAYQLENYYNLQYMLTIYVGSKQQELDIFIDTFTDWFLLISDDCKKCTTKSTFDSDRSTTLEYEDDDLYIFEYSNSEFYIYIVSDNIYLDERQNNGVKSFEFITAIDSTYEEDYTGFVGFCRNIQTKQSDGSYNAIQTPYYYGLYYEGTINSPSFALSLNDYSDSSYITFGGADFDRFANTKGGKVNIPVYDYILWYTFIEGFMLGSDEYTFKYEDEFQTYFDTSLNTIFLPYSIGDDIIDLLLEDMYYELYEDFILVECSDGYKYMKSLYFLISEHYYELPVKTMLYDLGDDVCIFMIFQNNVEAFQLGLPFMINYYMYFNNLKDVITISPSKWGYVDYILTKNGKRVDNNDEEDEDEEDEEDEDEEDEEDEDEEDEDEEDEDEEDEEDEDEEDEDEEDGTRINDKDEDKDENEEDEDGEDGTRIMDKDENKDEEDDTRITEKTNEKEDMAYQLEVSILVLFCYTIFISHL